MVGAMFTSIDIPATEQQFQGADPAVGISLPPGLRHSEKRLRKRRDLDAVGAAAAVLPQINSTPGMKHYHTNICLKWWPLVTLARVLFLPVSTVQLGKHRNQGALGLNVIVSMVFFLYFFCAQSLARPLPAVETMWLVKLLRPMSPLDVTPQHPHSSLLHKRAKAMTRRVSFRPGGQTGAFHRPPPLF